MHCDAQSYDMSWMTRDGLYKTPVGSYSLPLYSCQYSETWSDVSTASAYASALSKDASTGFSLGASGVTGGLGGSYKGSKGYQESENDERNTNFCMHPLTPL